MKASQVFKHFAAKGQMIFQEKMAVTGAREGMTAEQVITFTQLLIELQPTEFHHGCAIGADHQALRIVIAVLDTFECRVFAHPSNIEEQRVQAAIEASDDAFAPLPPLERNRIMVDSTSYLVAFPYSPLITYRGGTWSTIHYGLKYKKKVHKPVMIVLPNGQIVTNLSSLQKI